MKKIFNVVKKLLDITPQIFISLEIINSVLDIFTKVRDLFF